MKTGLPEIVIGKRDYGCIENMVGGYASARRPKVVDDLEREIARAIVVEDDRVPPRTVTMGARVRYRDADTGRERTATLSYPDRTHEAEDAVSLFTPVGVALLGLSEGQTIAYETPDGRVRTLTVSEVLRRPGARP